MFLEILLNILKRPDLENLAHLCCLPCSSKDKLIFIVLRSAVNYLERCTDQLTSLEPLQWLEYRLAVDDMEHLDTFLKELFIYI